MNYHCTNLWQFENNPPAPEEGPSGPKRVVRWIARELPWYQGISRPTIIVPALDCSKTKDSSAVSKPDPVESPQELKSGLSTAEP